MKRELIKKPDFYGIWIDKSEGINTFFMNAKEGKNGMFWGDITDKFGRALFFGNVFGDEIIFNKDYVANASKDAPVYTLSYIGKRIEGLDDSFGGKYLCYQPNIKGVSGRFVLQPFTDSDNFILEDFKKEFPNAFPKQN